LPRRPIASIGNYSNSNESWPCPTLARLPHPDHGEARYSPKRQCKHTIPDAARHSRNAHVHRLAEAGPQRDAARAIGSDRDFARLAAKATIIVKRAAPMLLVVRYSASLMPRSMTCHGLSMWPLSGKAHMSSMPLFQWSRVERLFRLVGCAAGSFLVCWRGIQRSSILIS